MTRPTLRGRRVVVGVCGSIAAYKACEVISRLRQEGAQVRVVATLNATRFVGLATLRALSGQDVACEMFGQIPAMEIEHVSLAEFGEVVVVVAATANVIAKTAAGICDDLLTTTLCAAAGKIIFAPAMNWRMWDNPVTQRNVSTLRELGHVMVGPDRGRLACGEEGVGRLASIEDILDAVDQALGPPDSKLRGRTVLITSGPTREWLDPVRFLSNPSSGKMGCDLAREALARGARVILVSGPGSAAAPWGTQTVRVETTAEMLQAVQEHVAGCDVLVGAAAPADFRPRTVADQKLKKEQASLHLELERTPDILATVAGTRGTRIHVGFAAETQDLEANALGKLERKGLDLVVANDVGTPGLGFGSEDNAVSIYGRQGKLREVGPCSKREVAIAIWDEVERLLA